MRIALVDQAGRAAELAAGLRDGGLAAHRVSAPASAVVDGVLTRRGFTGPLSPLPATIARLVAGRYDVAHAFSPPDALAALGWRRLTRWPVAFTCCEVLDRGNVANSRLRLDLLRRALEQTDAVVAAGHEARAGLARWFALDVPVLDPRDAAGHERLYRRLLSSG